MRSLCQPVQFFLQWSLPMEKCTRYNGANNGHQEKNKCLMLLQEKKRIWYNGNNSSDDEEEKEEADRE